MIYTAPGCAARYSTSKPSRAHSNVRAPPGRRAHSALRPDSLFVHPLARTPPWQRSTVSKAARPSPSGTSPTPCTRSPTPRRTACPTSRGCRSAMKVLLENLLRYEDGRTVTKADIEAVAAWIDNKGKAEKEIAFRPARVLMQDFTGVPAVVDLAAMRDAMKNLGGDPRKINPLVPVDLVIDHSVIVDEFGTPQAFAKNVELEYQRNGERYRFLKWGQTAFNNFSVVPPGTGICHQVNLEFLSQTVWSRKTEAEPTEFAYPDTLVGTDSHTTMVNGLAVLGWGVGGIEAEAAMLGQPISMLIPEVVGFKLTGRLREGVTATDLVLTVTQMLRKKGVVGKFVEFYGTGLADMTVADRATIGNMAPEYGATCGFFPIDERTIEYLRVTGRDRRARRARRGLCQGAGDVPRPRTRRTRCSPTRSSSNLDEVQPSLAGPKRPQDRVTLADAKAGFTKAMDTEFRKGGEVGEALPGRGRELRPRPRRRRHRGDHVLHQHLEPERHDRRRASRPQRGREGPAHQALGQDLARAGQPGRRRVPREGGPPGRSRRARLQPRRLRLHDLHRQFGAAARAGVEGDQRQRHRRRRGAVGQPQLRGPGEPRRARQLSRLAAARRRLRARRLAPRRPRQGAARHRRRRQAGLPQGHLADEHRDPALHRAHHHGRAVQAALFGRLHRRQQLEGHPGRDRAHLSSGRSARPTCRTRPISRA